MSEENEVRNSEGNGGRDTAVQGKENHEQGSNRQKKRLGIGIKKSAEITGRNTLIFAIVILYGGLITATHRQIPKPAQMALITAATFAAFFAESSYIKWKQGELPIQTKILCKVLGIIGIIAIAATAIAG